MNKQKTGRPSKVSILSKGKGFEIRFRKNGKRIRKSCKTRDHDQALSLAKQIEWLLIDEKSTVSTQAYELYFGELPKVKAPSKETINMFPDDTSRDYVIASLMKEVDRLKLELEDALPYKKMYKALESTREGKLLLQSETLPTVEEALDKYRECIAHLARPGASINFLLPFFESRLTHKIDTIKAIDIHTYLSKDCGDSGSRWQRQRQIFTQFFNRMTALWIFNDPMEDVMEKEKEHNEDIHWHKDKEVDAFLASLDNDYDKALFSTLFFTGVTASECRGLRVKDYFQLDGQWVIRVTPNECRSIKRAKRRRNINVGMRLKAVLDKYLKKHKEEYLFPPQVDSRNNFWAASSFSSYTSAIFPDKMNCKSTRRTYGSTMLREGNNVTEVAAAMGNSVLMVEKHYGRIKCSEVKPLQRLKIS